MAQNGHLRVKVKGEKEIMEKMTHYDRILRHLKDYGTIDSWTAIMDYGCTRLSHYIYLLRKDGYNIESETITSKNRYGESTHFAKYVLKGE